jgi:hypothetical protein
MFIHRDWKIPECVFYYFTAFLRFPSSYSLPAFFFNWNGKYKNHSRGVKISRGKAIKSAIPLGDMKEFNECWEKSVAGSVAYCISYFYLFGTHVFEDKKLWFLYAGCEKVIWIYEYVRFYDFKLEWGSCCFGMRACHCCRTS